MLESSRFWISDSFRFEVPTRELFRIGNDGSATPLPLGSRATDILLLFLQRPNQLVTKNEIMEAVWPNIAVEESNLPVQISAVRRALDGASTILTVPGRGYRFTLPVRSAGPVADPSIASAASLNLDPDELKPRGSEPGPTVIPFAPIQSHTAGRYNLGRSTKWLMSAIGTAALVATALLAINWKEYFAGRSLDAAAMESMDRPASQGSGACGSLPGVWEWFAGGNAYFYPDGHLRGGRFTGSWACTRGEVVIAWSHGHTDRVAISPGGTYLSGFNDINTPVWGRRIGSAKSS
jgi:DNA-binding winged helix-turn-helix (wHTH) protein